MNFQKRIEVQGSIMQMIDSFMAQNNVPAAVMEDALNKVLVQLKDAIMQEMLQEAYMANLQEIEPEQESKEEVSE